MLGNYRGRYGSNEQWDQRRSSLIQVIWAIMEDIFTHTRPYDSAAHTTLQCAYLNHFARAQARDSSCYLSRKWIIPTLCRTWRAGGGYTAALQWAAADPALLGMTAAIEAQVRATEDEAGVAGVQTPF